MKRVIWPTMAVFIVMLVAGCERALDLRQPKVSAEAVFDELWTLMDQRYALFGVKAANWQETYSKYRVQINDTMNDRRLFMVMSNMLETLRDGHVVLTSEYDTAGYRGFYEGFPINFNYGVLLKNYLGNDYKTIGPVQYKIVNNTGYIYYGSFASDISVADADRLIIEMKNTKGLIVDVRNNSGGNTSNAYRLFTHFLPSRKLVKYEWYKSGPGHDDFSDPLAAYLAPAAVVYDKPVVVLTNRSCYSACNDFVAFMSDLPRVAIMGDQTGGGAGVPHQYLLRNGWKLQYSATHTLSPNKQSIENGIVPDVKIDINPIDITNGKDPILEKAFASLQ